MDIDKEKVGKIIALQRKSLNMTQQDLADSLGLTRKIIFKWEYGYAMPSTNYLLPLCKILNISVDDLLINQRIPKRKINIKDNLISMFQSSKKIINDWLQITGLFLTILSIIVTYISLNKNVIEILKDTSTYEILLIIFSIPILILIMMLLLNIISKLIKKN